MEEWLEKFAFSAFHRSSDIAHDLKTPLNVAVLNLELLRMRVQKVCTEGADDRKLTEYMRSIEFELRRMARIYDAFFVNSVPPGGGELQEPVSISKALRHELGKVGFATGALVATVTLPGHRSRLNEACRLLAEGASKIFVPQTAVISEAFEKETYRVALRGRIVSGTEIGKIFKFYYTDLSGAPELTFATARLILETYGGLLEAKEEDDQALIELTLPIGEQ